MAQAEIIGDKIVLTVAVDKVIPGLKEEMEEIQGEPEEQPEEEKKELILNFIEEKGEFKYKAGEVTESTGIETADCTRITINLIEENKMKKKAHQHYILF